MYEIKQWTENLDLTDFYAEAERRGHQQTVWKVNVDVLYNQLAKFPRWK